jgi:hypothetical protein
MGKMRSSKGKTKLKSAINQARQAYANTAVDSEEEEEAAVMRRGRKTTKAESDDEDAVLDLAIDDDDSSDNDDDDDDDDDDEEEDDDKYGSKSNNNRDSSAKLTKKAQSESDDDDDDSDDSDDDSDLSDSNELKKLVDNLDPKIRQRIMLGDAADSSSDDEEDSDDDANNWGRKKNYYNGDTADLEIGQNVQDAEDEEVAAVELHKKMLSRMKDEDFYDNVEPESTKKSKKLMKVSSSKDDAMTGGGMFGNLKFVGLGNTKKQQVLTTSLTHSLTHMHTLRIIMSTACCTQSATRCIYISLCNSNY